MKGIYNPQACINLKDTDVNIIPYTLFYGYRLLHHFLHEKKGARIFFQRVKFKKNTLS